MAWIGLVYYQNKIDQIGGNGRDHNDTDLHYKIQQFVKGKCEKIEIYRNMETIFPAGIKEIKRKIKQDEAT